MDNNNVIYQARFLMASNWIKAVMVLEEALKNDENNVDIYIELADIFTQKTSYKKAQECLQKALNIEPNNTTARFKLAGIYLDLDQPTLALANYDKIEEFHPESLFNKALSYYHLHQTDDAIETLKELVGETNKIETAYHFLIELLLVTERITECYYYINETKKQYGDSPQLSYFLASNYAKEKKWLPAYTEYVKALPLYRNNSNLYQALGLSAEYIGQIDKAIRHLKDGIIACNNDKKLIIDLVKLYIKYNQISNMDELRNLLSDFNDDTIKMILNYYKKMTKNT